MLEKHYSPRAELTLFEGGTDAALSALVDAARELLSRGRVVGIIAAEEDREELAALASDRNALMCIIGSHDTPSGRRDAGSTPRSAISIRLVHM